MTFSSSVFVRSGWNLCLISLHTVAIFSVAPLFLFISNLCCEEESLMRKMSKSLGGRSLFPSENPSVLDSLTFSLSVTTSVSEKEEGCLCLQICDSSEFAPEPLAIGKPSKINDVNENIFWYFLSAITVRKELQPANSFKSFRVWSSTNWGSGWFCLLIIDFKPCVP